MNAFIEMYNGAFKVIKVVDLLFRYEILEDST